MITNQPLVSWICVTYGRDRLLEEVLYMFLNQTYDKKELIIVNDHPKIKYVFDSPDVIIYNLNERFSTLGQKRDFSKTLFNGEFIFFTDDDDVYYITHTEKLVNYHMENMNFDSVKNDHSHFSTNNVISNYATKNSLFGGMCFKKEYVINNSFGLKNTGQDLDFLRNAKVGKIIDNKTTHHYRWGMNVRHISGGGKVNNTKNLDEIYSLNLDREIIVNLKPLLLDSTQKYYFNF